MARTSPLVDTRIIYCGDCLDQLRKLPDGCVDLVYIDPPFNSNRSYEVFWGETKEKRAFEDRHASTQAYIEYMRPRCVELARVLKSTGSFYYHCDAHAGHYIKVMLDQLLGQNQFQNEIIWKRTSAHSSAKRFAPIHDTLLYYTKGAKRTWNPPRMPYEDAYLDKYYRFDDGDGRLHWRADLCAAGVRKGSSGMTWRGFDPGAKGMHWKFTVETLDELEAAGRIYWPKRGTGWPQYKRYRDELKGKSLGDIWDDIDRINPVGSERLGYPTQKPLALLERIIQASSNPNDIVLDAFCGCGTAVVASQLLKRQWIGIDISPTACRVMAKRLRKDCGLREDEKLWQAGRGFVVRDLPQSEELLRKMPPFEFENWAVIALGGIPNKAKVGDMGIDGRIFPVGAIPNQGRPKDTGEFDFMDAWYPIQVKQKDKVGRPDIDSFEAVMARTERNKGFFVSFDYTSDALTEIDAFFRKSKRVIIPFTVREILNEHLAAKLA